MRTISLVLASMLCSCAVLYAAGPAGTIAGSVQDSSGAAVPKAHVMATSTETGLTRETVSGSDGGYVVPLLPVGVYRISVRAAGFAGFDQTGIVVKADQNSAVPVTLKVGNDTQSVTVQANAEMLETRSGALSQVINAQDINQLPLNGRNPAALILLTPGTTNAEAGNAGNSAQQAIQSTTYPNNAEVINADGSRYDMINYNLDGGSAEDIYNDISNPFPNPDAVEEFSVVTNSYSAEYGRGAGAIVNVVTRSGTNQFHGGGFPRGKIVDTPVSHVDLTPTLLEIAGAPGNDKLRGHSVVGLANGSPAGHPGYAFSESHSEGNCTGSYMIRKGDWKYMHFVWYGNLLFNLRQDPGEFYNLAGDPRYREVEQELHGILTGLLDPEAVNRRAFDHENALLQAMIRENSPQQFYKLLEKRLGAGQANSMTYLHYKQSV